MTDLFCRESFEDSSTLLLIGNQASEIRYAVELEVHYILVSFEWWYNWIPVMISVINSLTDKPSITWWLTFRDFIKCQHVSIVSGLWFVKAPQTDEQNHAQHIVVSHIKHNVTFSAAIMNDEFWQAYIWLFWGYYRSDYFNKLSVAVFIYVPALTVVYFRYDVYFGYVYFGYVNFGYDWNL